MTDLQQAAIRVLQGNEAGGYIAPSLGLYTHQHLWDTCFTAIGQRHYDLTGAMAGVRRLLAAQWRGGMVPHIIFQPGWRHWLDRRNWRSWVSASAPPGLATGGITQPPMIAEAVVRIGECLPAAGRVAWYRSVYQPLVAYHEWLYRERGAGGSGLVVQIHPWETGLDNSPPWLTALAAVPPPWWLGFTVRAKLDRWAEHLRLDTRYVPAAQRSPAAEALRLYAVQQHIRARRYETAAVLARPQFAIEDVTYNSILIRAGTLLRQISEAIGAALPGGLAAGMDRHREALEALWDEADGCYYSRDARTGSLLKEPSIGALTPLYAGCLSEARAARLAAMLADPQLFATPYPVPTVPLTSRWFSPVRYWQGPAWVNINWLLIDGLSRHGHTDAAAGLRQRTLDLTSRSGFWEYYHPVTGQPAGARNFSWTAALTIDLLAALLPAMPGPGRPSAGAPPVTRRPARHLIQEGQRIHAPNDPPPAQACAAGAADRRVGAAGRTLDALRGDRTAGPAGAGAAGRRVCGHRRCRRALHPGTVPARRAVRAGPQCGAAVDRAAGVDPAARGAVGGECPPSHRRARRRAGQRGHERAHRPLRPGHRPVLRDQPGFRAGVE